MEALHLQEINLSIFMTSPGKINGEYQQSNTHHKHAKESIHYPVKKLNQWSIGELNEFLPGILQHSTKAKNE